MRRIEFLKGQLISKFNNKRTLTTILLIVLISVSLFIVLQQMINGIEQPEYFTELYFENHNNLPTKLAYPGQYDWYNNPTSNLYSFSFTVHNLENKDMNYSYEIYSVEQKKSVIDTGEIFVKSNQSETITEHFTYPVYHDRMKVVVSLPKKNQEISFWIERAVNETK